MPPQVGSKAATAMDIACVDFSDAQGCVPGNWCPVNGPPFNFQRGNGGPGGGGGGGGGEGGGGHLEDDDDDDDDESSNPPTPPAPPSGSDASASATSATHIHIGTLVVIDASGSQSASLIVGNRNCDITNRAVQLAWDRASNLHTGDAHTSHH
jgi:hypothetical protein